MPVNPGLLSSATPEWETPESLYADLNAHFGPFDLDPCATPENAKCERFFTKIEDGLSNPWHGKVFMNPPYGREISKWVRKAYQESLRGVFVVCLLPARTDTRWFHDWCVKGSIRFIKGRLHFNDSKCGAPFPSMIVIFYPHKESPCPTSSLS